MKALITGASSGIGQEIARELAARGYELILVARRRDRLEALSRELTVKCRIIEADLSDAEQCKMLYCRARSEDLEIVVNNAGFGMCGSFAATSLDRDLEMIRTNIVAVHILTKLFLHDFRLKNRGYILNVASSAGFMAGPLMATYYATKSYVLRLTEAPCRFRHSVRDRSRPSLTTWPKSSSRCRAWMPRRAPRSPCATCCAVMRSLFPAWA